MGVDTSAAWTDRDLWRVQLPGGEVRAMTLDALDEAFQAGLVDERCPVSAPGTSTWTTLAEVAGIDPEPSSSATPSLSPVATDLAPPSVAPSGPTHSAASAELDELDAAALAPKKGRAAAFVALGLVAAAGLVFAATRVGAFAASASNALVAPVEEKAAAAAPPPVSTVFEPAEGTSGKPSLTEEQRQRLLEADKARESARKAKTPAAPARGPRAKASSPFVNGGDKYDPLNGAL